MANISSDKTTILLKKTTRNLLASLGSKDQSFDEIVLNLIKKGVKRN